MNMIFNETEDPYDVNAGEEALGINESEYAKDQAVQRLFEDATRRKELKERI
jgi:hypothetical protein